MINARTFKRVPIYIKIYRNKVEITNLKTETTIIRTASENFSTTRNILGDFNKADSLVRSTLKELGLSHSFLNPQLKILIQQVEGTEDGLSEIEKRALRDIAELAGAAQVRLIEHSKPLSNDDAIKEFGEK